jgi:hypothetical protein
MATAIVKDQFGNTVCTLQPGQAIQLQDGWFIQSEDAADLIQEVPNPDNLPTVGQQFPDKLTT